MNHIGINEKGKKGKNLKEKGRKGKEKEKMGSKRVKQMQKIGKN